jgi:3-oxoadipate enol-lactonase
MEVAVTNEAGHVRKTSNRIGRAFYRASGCRLVFHGPAGVDHLSVAPVCPKTAQEGTMAVTSSRRDMLHFGGGAAAAIGVSAVAGALDPVRAVAQGASANNASAEDFYYRDDWFGEPWRKPETAVLIHGNAESSIVWYAWMPRVAQEFRVLRPDLPGLGRSRIPAGFEWSLPSLAAFVAHVLDKAGADSAHIIGAKAGGAIAMQFAADYPARTRTLSVVHVPSAATSASGPASATSFAPQRARLGSAASKEMVDYWENMFATAPAIPTKGLLTAVSKTDPERDGVLQRIKAPTLLMTADRGQLQSVEKAWQYQTLIPNSRLVVLRSDGYHIAASNADECVTNVLAFIKEARKRA